ncbi:hepatitis A virus cellular receptor 1 homolog [Micropterus salmoides]|uniref:hepatitis A virus cellular receptor 1 homolog n=1 Tax=Micropterus salmoides TaxID=27706 RepID=UPI0018EA738B|nr:hepatitis A virus cellular receptor 1 homolog [Micropterus salmoides]
MWIMKTESRLDLMLLLVLLTGTVGESDGSSVVGQTGQSVTLSCKYDISKHGAQHVCWGRGKLPKFGCSDQLVSTDGHKVITRASSRYQLLGRLEAGDVSLTILDLTETDAGRYGCMVEIPGWFNNEKHQFDLIIETAPFPTTITANNKPTEVARSRESLIGNTLRVSFIIIVPALLLITCYRVWRRNQTDRRLNQSEKDTESL